MPMDVPIALDRASIRTVDPTSGHLHVGLTPISKANCCIYMGSEIPDAQQLGLDPSKQYNLYRDPKALAAAADTFNGKPLMVIHKPQMAQEHDRKVVVGSVNNATFKAPYLYAELAVWDQDGIDLIESGEQRQLSCGYFYRAQMVPGVTPEGEAYDGSMQSISGNHVSLVSVGRAGPDVMVGDSALPLITTPIPETTPAATPETGTSPSSTKEILMAKNAVSNRAALMASSAILTYAHPKMATDGKLDLGPMLKGVTAKNWKAKRPQIAVALDAALKGQLAEGADISDIPAMLTRLDAIAADAEPDDDEDDKKRKAKEAAEKLKEAAAEDESDDDDDDDDDEETKKKKAKEAAEKLKEAAAEDESDDDSAMDEDDDDDDDKKKPAKDKKGARDKKGAHDSALAPKAPKVPMVSKQAMDSAIASAVAKVRRDTEASTIARLRSIQDAEKAVRPYIGELAIAQDSAEAVYRLALDHADVDLEGVPEAAFAAMVKMLPKPGDVPTVARARVAMDSKALDDNFKRFPGVTALKHR